VRNSPCLEYRVATREGNRWVALPLPGCRGSVQFNHTAFDPDVTAVAEEYQVV
jgi:hypothetical protein